MREKPLIILENLFPYLVIHGVVAHELAHLIAAKLLSVDVISYTLFSHPESLTKKAPDDIEVRHRRTGNEFKSNIISLFPVILNTSLCAATLYLVKPVTLSLSAPLNYASAILGLWISFGFLLGAVPSKRDFESVGLERSGHLHTLLSVLLGPVYLGLMYLLW